MEPPEAFTIELDCIPDVFSIYELNKVVLGFLDITPRTDPATYVRASLVCTWWHNILSARHGGKTLHGWQDDDVVIENLVASGVPDPRFMDPSWIMERRDHGYVYRASPILDGLFVKNNITVFKTVVTALARSERIDARDIIYIMPSLLWSDRTGMFETFVRIAMQLKEFTHQAKSNLAFKVWHASTSDTTNLDILYAIMGDDMPVEFIIAQRTHYAPTRFTYEIDLPWSRQFPEKITWVKRLIEHKLSRQLPIDPWHIAWYKEHGRTS